VCIDQAAKDAERERAREAEHKKQMKGQQRLDVFFTGTPASAKKKKKKKEKEVAATPSAASSTSKMDVDVLNKTAPSSSSTGAVSASPAKAAASPSKLLSSSGGGKKKKKKRNYVVAAVQRPGLVYHEFEVGFGTVMAPIRRATTPLVDADALLSATLGDQDVQTAFRTKYTSGPRRVSHREVRNTHMPACVCVLCDIHELVCVCVCIRSCALAWSLPVAANCSSSSR
jgi:hypothetical protein